MDVRVYFLIFTFSTFSGSVIAQSHSSEIEANHSDDRAYFESQLYLKPQQTFDIPGVSWGQLVQYTPNVWMFLDNDIDEQRRFSIEATLMPRHPRALYISGHGGHAGETPIVGSGLVPGKALNAEEILELLQTLGGVNLENFDVIVFSGSCQANICADNGSSMTQEIARISGKPVVGGNGYVGFQTVEGYIDPANRAHYRSGNVGSSFLLMQPDSIVMEVFFSVHVFQEKNRPVLVDPPFGVAFPESYTPEQFRLANAIVEQLSQIQQRSLNSPSIDFDREINAFWESFPVNTDLPNNFETQLNQVYLDSRARYRQHYLVHQLVEEEGKLIEVRPNGERVFREEIPERFQRCKKSLSEIPKTKK